MLAIVREQVGSQMIEERELAVRADERRFRRIDAWCA